MKTQTCYTCQKELPNDMFASGKQKLKQCKPCMNDYSKTHYKNNKERRMINVKLTKERLYNEVAALKESQPCKDCGKSYQACVMTYDHLDPSTKIGDVGTMIQNCNRIKLFEEIAKCELVCSNCHAIRTWKRRRGLL